MQHSVRTAIQYSRLPVISDVLSCTKFTSTITTTCVSPQKPSQKNQQSTSDLTLEGPAEPTHYLEAKGIYKRIRA